MDEIHPANDRIPGAEAMSHSAYTVYTDDGITKIVYGTVETLRLNVSPGEKYVEGEFPDDEFFVKDGSLKKMPPRPDYPCTFDRASEMWIWDEAVSWILLRIKRDDLLSSVVDPVVSNHLRWGAMSPAAQEAYAVYRQALLDLPTNTADPRDVIWPDRPQ